MLYYCTDGTIIKIGVSIMKKISFAIIVLAITLGYAYAEKTVPGLYTDASIGAMVNPFGTEIGEKLYYRFPFISSDNILFASTKLDVGIDNRTTPAYNRLMIFASFEPIAILDLSTHIGYMQTYKALGFGFVQLPSYEAEYDQKAVDSLPQKNKAGLWSDVTVRLKAGFPLGNGKVIASYAFTVNYIRFGKARDGYFYERQQDFVFKMSDLSLIHDAMVGYLYGENLLVGVDNYYVLVPRSGERAWTLSGLASYNLKITKDANFSISLLSGPQIDKQYYQGKINTIVQSGISVRLR